MNRLRSAVLAGLVVLAALVGLVVPATSASAAAPATSPVSRVYVWGDSMTLVWPSYLGQLLGIPVVNAGVGGENVQQTKARFDTWVTENPSLLATTGHLCWCGHTNANLQNDNPETILPVVQSMAAQVPSNRFMPIGLTNGPDAPSGSPGYQAIVKGVNVDLQNAFKALYAEVRRYLVTDGLRVAGITATAEDNRNIAADVPPASLRTIEPGNPAHLNDAGRHVTASRLNDLIRGASWLVVDASLLATSTTAQSTLNPSPQGYGIRIQTEVTNVSGRPGVPTGTVRFQVDRRVVGTPVVLKNGQASSALVKTLSVGSHTITVYYDGDAQFAKSTATFTQVVTG
ncbi:MAG: Ig-like domain repeat protein [Geodermatophilaceae bacterium]|nr:Ig-like domain repeat protein [Geodermatophilaceae bacterium]